ncbi:MAG TPA: Ig-like domain-containing protein, partial [Pyrinomonadaceae bacterium]|nr:Ig-like domain-containing protein [Pyrinomonadaceae bacterium]
MSRLLTLILALALTTLVFVSIPVSAVNGTFTIGANDNNSRYPIGLDPSANGTSFPNFQTGGTYQQVYAKSAFSGPVTITQIAFASHELTSNPGIANYNFSVSLGATAAVPNALSTNLATNRGPQLAPVFSGPLNANITDGAQFDVLIDITPFTYDPASGNLLMEINFNAPVQFSGGSLLYFRAGANSLTSRAANPSGVAGGAFTDNFGLLTRFTTQSNTAPDAHDDATTINEDSSANAISVLANDTDQDNDTLAITAVTQGAHGLVAITGGGSGLTYTPATDYSGTDTFTYTISDGHGGSDTASVNVTINAINDTPSFTKGADQTVNEDAGAKTINNWASNISAGPANESNQTLDFIVTNDNNQLFAVQPSVATDGILTYKPAANAFGVASVSVKLHDNGGGQDTSAAQTFKITVKPVADFPSASPANTTVNTQTTNGLVIDRNLADGPEVTHFKFFSVTNGRLFKHDGVTEIPSGGVITVAEGQAGLKFTPDSDLYSPQSFFFFTVVAGLGPASEDFNSGFLTVSIGVTCTEAQVFVVSNSNDSGPGSLRDVLSNACSGGKVTFDMSPGHVTSPITLTSGELAIGQEQTIAGPTDTSLVINGNDNSRVFNVNWWQANLKISNLTITGGKANSGAGIRSEGSLTIKDSTLTGNNAVGADGSGGAIDTTFGSHLTIINSTISGNTAQGYGGGLRNLANDATLTNVTITNNRADSNGDGLEYDGGIIQLGSNMNLRNSLVAGNFKGTGNTASDLTGNATDPYAAISRNNLIGVDDVSTGLDPATNLLGTLANPINPLLGPLADNGGPTRTHLLLLGSPAIKAGVNALADANTTDQRGFSRAVSGPIDIGAVEVNYAISATGGTPQSATIGSLFATPLQATVTESGIPRSGVLITFAAPANGASGSFSGSATVATDSNGVATAPAFTANSIVGGPYNVTATEAGGSTSAVFVLTNAPATAQVTLSNLVQTFDGNPKSVSASSNPAGLNIVVTYNGSATAPTNAGSYAVTA